MPPTPTNGKICYVEIPAIEVPRAVEFYQKVFGWKVRHRDDGRPAFVAATIDAVAANGGELVQPIRAAAPEITARFRDPAGNIIGLYQQPGN